MTHMEARFIVSLGLCDPPGVHLLPCIAFSEPAELALTRSLLGQDCYCPETTLVEVPVWPAPLGGSQATSACALLDNGSFHVVSPRKPAESFCPPVHFPFCPLHALCQEVFLPCWSCWDSWRDIRQGHREAKILGPAEGCTIRTCWQEFSPIGHCLEASGYLIWPKPGFCLPPAQAELLICTLSP